MKQILKLVFLLVIGQTAFGQAPSNYTNINGRYRWIAGMFDSTFHIPKGSTPSLRTGGSTNSGGLFYNTSDSSVYTYTGTQWIKLRGSINPSDTTNKYVTQVYKKSGSDSIFYVKGGVHTWAFNDSTGSPGGGGGGKVYYFNGGVDMGTIGGLQMYELGDTANTGAAANFTRSTTGNIANFITDPGKPGLLEIPAGVWSVDAWLSETGGGANHAEIWVEVEKWDGSTITTIATSPIEQITEGATPNLYSWSVSIPTTSLTVTDRIIIQFYISNTNGKTVTLYTQNGYVGEVHTTFTTGIGAINGLTAPAQYLVTGTSGTDFNINSSTATHTFNLPTASATNRGALSTTDWSTFNNKIGGSLVSGYLTKATGTNTIDTSQIYQSNGKIGIGRTNPTAKVDVYDSLGTGVKSTMRSQINTDVALDVKTVGNRGFALIIDQADSVASGTQYQTLFRKSMMPGTGNPANGGGVSWYTQIGNDNNVYRALSVYRARVIDSTGFANSNIQQTSTEFWTRKAGVWDTTLVLNGGNVGINTGQNGIDSALTVANGTWLKRGVRMSALPTGVGTKALRIDANGTLSVADTLTNGVSGSLTANFIPKATGTTTLNNSPLSVGSGVVGLGLGVVPPNSWTNYWALQLANGVSLASYNYADIPIGWLGTNAYHDGIGDIRVSNGAANKYLQDRGNHKWYVAGYGASGSYISWTQPMILDTLNRLTIGVTTPDSMFKVAQGVHLERGVRMSGLPTGVGTKAVRINANGTLSVADTLANGISGTGTTNYIPKFTSSSAIGNSIVQDLGTGISVGGTTTSNGYINNQASSISSSGGVFRLSNGYTYLIGSSTGNGSILSNGDGTATIQARSPAGNNGYLIFETGAGSERMRLDASGNLGLGTSSPSYKFQAYSSGDVVIAITDASNAGISALNLGNTTNLADGGIRYDNSTDALIFRANNSERARIDASGNLGLGVTPSAWLSAYKAIQFGIGGALIGRSDDAGIELSSNAYRNSVGSYNYLNTSASTSYRQYLGSHQWFNAPSGTAGNAISFTQAMTLDASGNLGIGSTSPGGSSTDRFTTIQGSSSATLQVIKTSDITGQLFAGSGQVGLFATTNHPITFGTNNSERMRLTSTGLGIGTTSPSNLLEVVGSTFVQIKSSNFATVGINRGGGFRATSTTNGGTNFFGDLNAISNNGNAPYNGVDGVYLGSRTSGFPLGFTVNNAGTEILALNIASTGAATFNSSTGLITAFNTSNANGGYLVLRQSAADKFYIGARGVVSGDGGTGYDLYTAAGNDIRFFAGGTKALTLATTGAATFSSSVTATNFTASNGGDFAWGHGSTYIDGDASNQYIRVIVNNSERMRITSDGTLMVGTTSQTYNNATYGYVGTFKSPVSQAYLSIATSGQTPTSQGMLIGLDNTAAAIYVLDNKNLNFYTNTTERMRITSTGELLINTTSDAGDYKLQVNGNVYATGGSIINNQNATTVFSLNNSTAGGSAFTEFRINASVGTGAFGKTSASTTAYKTIAASDLYIYNNTGAGNIAILNDKSGGSITMATNGNSTAQFTLTSSGNVETTGSIKTAAPSGGNAAAWKLGERVASSGVTFNDQQYIQLDIGGTLYYLATVDLPMPEAYPQATSGPSNNYKMAPVQVKTTRDAEIEKLRKEIEELKQLIKNK